MGGPTNSSHPAPSLHFLGLLRGLGRRRVEGAAVLLGGNHQLVHQGLAQVEIFKKN